MNTLSTYNTPQPIVHAGEIWTLFAPRPKGDPDAFTEDLQVVVLNCNQSGSFTVVPLHYYYSSRLLVEPIITPEENTANFRAVAMVSMDTTVTKHVFATGIRNGEVTAACLEKLRNCQKEALKATLGWSALQGRLRHLNRIRTFDEVPAIEPAEGKWQYSENVTDEYIEEYMNAMFEEIHREQNKGFAIVQQAIDDGVLKLMMPSENWETFGEMQKIATRVLGSYQYALSYALAAEAEVVTGQQETTSSALETDGESLLEKAIRFFKDRGYFLIPQINELAGAYSYAGTQSQTREIEMDFDLDGYDGSWVLDVTYDPIGDTAKLRIRDIDSFLSPSCPKKWTLGIYEPNTQELLAEVPVYLKMDEEIKLPAGDFNSWTFALKPVLE